MKQVYVKVAIKTERSSPVNCLRQAECCVTHHSC